ncbi:Poly(A) RNA polymerase cid13 [Echria macrotheca]|uniref:polynucleotide adenylyltransferase n=1 Tax=Echria macrotheca TaxID=438768 RepID=A0AAJ0FEZ6_9PEZI|nr:Poly(A) RNA polymerase cid13 [Echria macrotheca]
MENRPTTAETKPQYQPKQWPRSASGSTAQINPPPAPDAAPAFYAPPFDILPIWLPQQQTFHQDRLLQYNKLVSAGRGGGGLQNASHPPGSSPHASTRSRSSSKVSAKDSFHAKSGAQSGHGNRAAKATDTADRAPIASGKLPTAKMQTKKAAEAPASQSLPLRPPPATKPPPLPAAQSSSVPSTPYQHARKFSYESREPSPGANPNHSPRSAYSETNANIPPLRVVRCPYETGSSNSRRRMPYSLGIDRLEKIDPDKIKSRLSEDEEKQLTADMEELKEQLQPTKEVESKRQKLVQKLETILNKEWPSAKIKAHLFGSSGNLLCSDDSDVDICITTTSKELEKVCSIADVLHKRGMENVVCVSTAKVPIVKMRDPELKLNCDLSVNTLGALENTRMVRTYVEIDERVRPLAMIIKYWTRRRIVNVAGVSATLSSYTWMCMIIAFLQLRDPPVLPALHQRDEKLQKDSLFGDDLDKLRGYGAKNKESLANLLFQFFRFYAHDFDYDKYVLSVRCGKLLTKTEKGWQHKNNNPLCVEEPFNTQRNLGNTADETSFRGLHLELRRAFDLISEGKLEECCEEYIFPKEEERVFQKQQAPRPVLLRSSSQQHAGRGGRGGFSRSRQFRNGSSNRRASSSVPYDTNAVPNPHSGMYTAPLLQNFVFYPTNSPLPQEFMVDPIRYSRDAAQIWYAHQHLQQLALAQAQQRSQNGPAQPTDRSRAGSFDQPPLTAPIQDYSYRMPFMLSSVSEPYSSPFGTGTVPPSPASASTEFRRSPHRGGVAGESGSSGGSGTVRSQSQPASRTSMGPPQPPAGYMAPAQLGLPITQPRHVSGVPIPSFMSDEMLAGAGFDDGARTKAISDSPPEDDGPRYVAYYVNESTSPPRRVNSFASGVPVFGDINQLPQTILDRRMKRTSRSPSPMGHARAFSTGTNSAPLKSSPFQVNGKLTPTRAPLVVNGSIPKPNSTPGGSRPLPVAEPLPIEEFNHDNPLYINQGYGFNNPWVEQPNVLAANGADHTPPSASDRPVIVNGSSTNRSPATAQMSSEDVTPQRMALPTALPNAMPYAPPLADTSAMPGFTESPPPGRSRVVSRQQQIGIAPLDLAAPDFNVDQDIQQHLSPVYEHRTPSPTAVRRFEAPPPMQSPLVVPAKENRGDAVSSHSKNASGWQKQKSRKKAVADLKAAANGLTHGEQLSKNDTKRIGG